MSCTNKIEIDAKFLYLFRDSLTKHLYEMKERPQSEIIEEVYNKLTSMIDSLQEDK